MSDDFRCPDCSSMEIKTHPPFVTETLTHVITHEQVARCLVCDAVWAIAPARRVAVDARRAAA